MANDASFDKLIDEVEFIDSLLDDGPGDDSGEFLTSVQDYANRISATASQLTVGDVDAEFTDDDDESEAANNGEG